MHIEMNFNQKKNIKKIISNLKKYSFFRIFFNLLKNILTGFINILSRKTTLEKELDYPNIQIIKQLFEEPKCFIDCGPGIINSEAWHIKKLWPKCAIIGIEACPNRYKKIKRKYPGILINKALDSKISEEYGYVGGSYNQFCFGLEKEDKRRGITKYAKIRVKTITLDYIEQKYGPFDTIFIWADIEGAELRMLRGAERILSSKKIIGLNLELWPRNARKIWDYYTGIRCTAIEVIKYLKSFGFSLYGDNAQNLLKNDTDFESKEWFNDYIFINEEIELKRIKI